MMTSSFILKTNNSHSTLQMHVAPFLLDFHYFQPNKREWNFHFQRKIKTN